MEGVSTKVYKGLKGYWRRRGYERISGSGRKRVIPAIRLGSGGSTRKTRVWNVKIYRKIKLKCLFGSPKKFFIGIRDAYVRSMMRLASSGAVGVSGYGNGGEARFVTRPVKEYDEKMVVELYKKILMGRNQLVHPDGSELVIRRKINKNRIQAGKGAKRERRWKILEVKEIGGKIEYLSKKKRKLKKLYSISNL